jgi:glycosyltransferase involved in cell wall biosynthesis
LSITTTERRRARVLVDLSHAADGYVGIAQDTRLIFDMLAGLETASPAGLLMPTGRHDLPRIGPKAAGDPATIAGVVHWMARNWATRPYPGRFGRAMEAPNLLRTDYQLVQLQRSDVTGALWRVLFEKTLPPEHRERVLAQDYFATDLSVMRIIDRAMRLPRLPPKRLDARGFDYAFFCMPRPVRLPASVRQLVRFHDAVPVTDTDTVATWRTGVAHQRLVRQCPADAVFVCNSEQSRNDLVALDPRRATLAEVIPCALAPPPRAAPLVPAASIVEGRRVWRALPGGAPAEMPRFEPGTRYVLAVSTLEPRKNYPGLIRGWERVVNRSDPDLKLVIVANKGWLEEPVLRAMVPHVRAGRIVHLAGLPTDELVSIARQATCFAFPSFNEGFGYPPLEALQNGAPCVVSDIPVFRWTFGDAALFVDPYDPESIAQGIERVAVLPGHEAVRAALAARAPAVLARFQPDAVAQLWAALLERHRRV